MNHIRYNGLEKEIEEKEIKELMEEMIRKAKHIEELIEEMDKK